jgi:hypothetical protein
MGVPDFCGPGKSVGVPDFVFHREEAQSGERRSAIRAR